MTARYPTALAALAALALALGACHDPRDADQQWEQDGGTGTGGEPVEVVRVLGDAGDIEVGVRLAPADGQARSVRVLYTGACAGGEWVDAFVVGETRDLHPGFHALTWASWDTEAGCKGTVRLRVETERGESGESDAFVLDNSRPGMTGFFQFPPVGDAGFNEEERQAFERAIDALIADPGTDFVATRAGDLYEVYAARGFVSFTRNQTRIGYQYEIDEIDGVNPLGRQDPDWMPDLAAELATGANPNNATIPDQGYPLGDPRLSFVEAENDSYPFGYERIAAYFDHPNSADLFINRTGYGHGEDGHWGSHGSLNVIQSRSPLLFYGAGIRDGVAVAGATKQVDIAPTIGKLMGFEPVEGVDRRGIWSKRNYLTWQDGTVIEDVLDGDVAEYVILFVLDGMNHNELVNQVLRRPEELPNLARVMDGGAWIEHGSITNYPSVTYPSHNVVGTGAYSAHHGIVDNVYFVRGEQDRKNPIGTLFKSEKLWDPIGPVETLHDAVHRNFGRWDPETGEGAFTASLLDPCTHGADKADLEFRDRSGRVPFPGLNLETPFGVYPPPFAVRNPTVWMTQWTATLEMRALWALFTNGVSPMPKFVVFNIMATDQDGHENGPHGDDMEDVLNYYDQNLGLLLDWLDLWLIADETAIVITSDHGMQLGDPTRFSYPPDALAPAGVRQAAATDLGIYLKTPVADFSVDALAPATEQTVTVGVVDEDDATAIAGALIEATDGTSTFTATTGADGRADLTINPIGPVTVGIYHPKFTSRFYTLPLEN